MDCLFKFLGVVVSSEYRGKGIATTLRKVSVDIAEQLSKGVNVKQSLKPDQEIPLEPIPKAISCIFTSSISQKIAKKLGFEVAAEKSYDLFEYKGRKFSSVIGSETPNISYQFKML